MGCKLIDEIAGIIAYEMLHSVGFHHGSAYNSDDSCGYSTNTGDGFECGTSSTCRMNSLNEIVEACISEVVEKSTQNCNPTMCDGNSQLSIYSYKTEGRFQCRYEETF